ncbi:hypothetical protein PVAND_009618 [Polypedilum vanderplanki]|uniref:Uncharacterized protein n=1 Tax=Polypedilum vanderplanki TaxID=319348 RepID=A0A9J6CDB3_POLVA|nr:hypothetical protein PVAND_009618 [Polypedilum vanderplanki]
MCDEMQYEFNDYQQQQNNDSNMMYCNMNECPSSSSPANQCEQESYVQYCDPNYQSCEPLCCPPTTCEPQPQPPMQMCEQTCNSFLMPKENYCEPSINICATTNRIRTPCKRGRYIQPPRRQSFKPSACYKRPEIPMSGDTIYRRSYEGVDACTAACCRAPPVRPNGLLRTPCAKFDGETITQLSFQPYCRIERVRPIVPQPRSLLGKGPIQGLTTQKHDYVPKFQYKRMRFSPRDNLRRINGCFEKETIHRLSFLPPCVNSKVQSFKPLNFYKKPELPMDCETVQKLSYTPVCPSPREDMPWARKARYQAPTIPFANDTITRLSYQAPGCFIDDNECCYETNCNEGNFCDVPRAAC